MGIGDRLRTDIVEPGSCPVETNWNKVYNRAPCYQRWPRHLLPCLLRSRKANTTMRRGKYSTSDTRLRKEHCLFSPFIILTLLLRITFLDFINSIKISPLTFDVYRLISFSEVILFSGKLRVRLTRSPSAESHNTSFDNKKQRRSQQSVEDYPVITQHLRFTNMLL